jgi:hypothetical protein
MDSLASTQLPGGTPYSHTQRAPLHLLLAGVGCLLLTIALQNRQEPAAVAIGVFLAVMLFVLALSFRSLTVADEGEYLSVRFGPLPLFGKRISYSEITAVEAGKSSIIDAWGIHWRPMRGWTINLWGFQCAVVHLGNRIIRIGTDDADSLVRLLRQRTGLRS